jgi:hypothetical protein
MSLYGVFRCLHVFEYFLVYRVRLYPLTPPGTMIVEAFIPCKKVTKKGTLDRRNFLLKGVKSDHNGVMKSLFIRRSNRVILLIPIL